MVTWEMVQMDANCIDSPKVFPLSLYERPQCISFNPGFINAGWWMLVPQNNRTLWQTNIAIENHFVQFNGKNHYFIYIYTYIYIYIETRPCSIAILLYQEACFSPKLLARLHLNGFILEGSLPGSCTATAVLAAPRTGTPELGPSEGSQRLKGWG